jgi:amino acid adenylation domain-containing protein
MNTDLLALLDECRARGVTLVLEDGQLRARGDAAALTAELRDALREHRRALVDLLGGGDLAEDDGPVRRSREGDQPLSSAQHRLWFVTELAPESRIAYNIVAAVRIGGDLRVDILERALAEIVRRHETLRTAFVAVDGQPWQRIDHRATLTLRRIELADDRAAIDRFLIEEGRKPFDLRAAPLIRGVVARSSGGDHVLALVLHHLVSDGWSSGVIVSELAALYEAFSAGRASPLPDLPLQYADYVEWQQHRLAGSSHEADLAFWKHALDGVPTLNLPTDHPRPPRPTYAGTSAGFRLPAQLTDRLDALGRRDGATRFMTLLAGFAVLLFRYSGQTDIAIGTTVANRPRQALEPLIGFFTNMLALRTDLSGNPSFAALVGRIRDTARAAYDHQDVPFDRVVEAVRPERVLGQNPLVQVCFSLLQAHRDALELGGLDIVQLDPPSPAARFDLTLTMEDTRDGLIGAFEYSTDLFEPETIVRLIVHWRNLLEAAALHPDWSIADLPLLDQAERHRILVEWNHSSTDYPKHHTIHQLFEEQAVRSAGAIAVRAGQASLTYGQLNAAANRLARRLRARDVGPDRAVAVAAIRSIDMIIELLAVLKAGGHYVPFDPADPVERLAFVFGQVHPAVILAPASEHARLAPHGLEILSAAGVRTLADDSTDLPGLADPDNLAYTTYTSGSTGVPKGICIPHRGVVRLVRNTNYMEFNAALVFLEIAPVSFDASTFEIWGALLNGAELVVMPGDAPSVRELGAAIERDRVTTLYLTSALFNVMVDERVSAFARVRQLLVGGDIISVPHARKLLAVNPGVALINGYGPTETTTFASCGVMTAPGDVGHTVTIGRPISNTVLYVLDDRLNPVPVGVSGDLYIGGDGNARGYLNLPALTAESFRPCPFGAPGSRMYRTGDLARYLPDGTLEFQGRKDHQVKLRGFRVELGEIENVLTAIDGVSESVVVIDEARPGDKRLIAWVQPRRGCQLTEAHCARALRDKLPDYMVPSAFVFVDALPLTPHNKIDRKALRAMAPVSGELRRALAPATPLEKAVAHIWQSVLGIDQLGVTDSFFELGGHSLLATQVMWRVFETFRVELPLRRLFEAPTVTEFVGALEKADGASGRLTRIAEIYEQVRELSPDEVARRLSGRTGLTTSR